MDMDQFLQQCCDKMDDEGIVILPETLAEYQNEYDEELCRIWIEETCNG